MLLASRAACGIVSFTDVTSRDMCPCDHAPDVASRAIDCIADAHDTASWAQRVSYRQNSVSVYLSLTPFSHQHVVIFMP